MASPRREFRRGTLLPGLHGCLLHHHSNTHTHTDTSACTHTHTAKCKRTHTPSGRQQLRLSKAARAEVWNQAEEEEGTQTRDSERRMSQFVDHGVVSLCGRIRNIPMLELLAVSVGPCIPPSLPSSPSVSQRRYLGQDGGCLGLEVGLTG